MELLWHTYRYYPYERELARREVHSILGPASVVDTERGIRIRGRFSREGLERLVYFSAATDGENSAATIQAQLERVNGNGANRQSTRYSAHGLHEYKGKFNPQIVRAILNMLGQPTGCNVVDPFCGSGTTLLECAHVGIRAIGTDMNPLAVFIANAKLLAVKTEASRLHRALEGAVRTFKQARVRSAQAHSARSEYLLSWFDPEVLDTIERMRLAIEKSDPACSAPLLAIASNLLRDYSQQDPNDLRIRRRKTPLPETPFVDAFQRSAEQFISKVADAQGVLGRPSRSCAALLMDSRKLFLPSADVPRGGFSCAITSPPYATALPYIDTQRLSLVWLGLIQPSEILRLEAALVGSREVRGDSKKNLLSKLLANEAKLPRGQAAYCRKLQGALSPTEDGFRRQAAPLLLYRYFVGMSEVFRALRAYMKKHAPFALVVGSNHTTLGGQRFDIDTPRHLAELAAAQGWVHEETLPLQTYQRYGYHMSNAVSSEALVVVRAA